MVSQVVGTARDLAMIMSVHRCRGSLGLFFFRRGGGLPVGTYLGSIGGPRGVADSFVKPQGGPPQRRQLRPRRGCH